MKNNLLKHTVKNKYNLFCFLLVFLPYTASANSPNKCDLSKKLVKFEKPINIDYDPTGGKLSYLKLLDKPKYEVIPVINVFFRETPTKGYVQDITYSVPFDFLYNAHKLSVVARWPKGSCSDVYYWNNDDRLVIQGKSLTSKMSITNERWVCGIREYGIVGPKVDKFLWDNKINLDVTVSPDINYNKNKYAIKIKSPYLNKIVSLNILKSEIPDEYINRDAKFVLLNSRSPALHLTMNSGEMRKGEACGIWKELQESNFATLFKLKKESLTAEECRMKVAQGIIKDPSICFQ